MTTLTQKELKEVTAALKDNKGWSSLPNSLKEKLEKATRPIKSVAVLSWYRTPIGHKEYHGIYHKTRYGIELPGGKVEPGETVEEAALREFQEEFGPLSIKPEIKKLFTANHFYNEVEYECTVVSFGDIGQISASSTDAKVSPVTFGEDFLFSGKYVFTFRKITEFAILIEQYPHEIKFH